MSHLFGLIWPPANGRLITHLHAYHHRNWERRAEWISWERNNPDPQWKLYLWLPAHYYPEYFIDYYNLTVPDYTPITDEQLAEIDRIWGDQWMVSANGLRFRDPVEGQPTTLVHEDQLRFPWRMVHHFYSADRIRFPTPVEYYRQGTELVRHHLPIARWLANWGIIPTDDALHPYSRR